MEVEGFNLVLDTFGDVNETTAEWRKYYRMLYIVQSNLAITDLGLTESLILRKNPADLPQIPHK